MSELTLPGDIPGLLRRCSPVRVKSQYSGWAGSFPCIVMGIHGTVLVKSDLGAEVWTPPGNVVLDITDATGRAHAAWWAWEATRKVTNGTEHKYWPAGRGPRSHVTKYNDLIIRHGLTANCFVHSVALFIVCLVVASLAAKG